MFWRPGGQSELVEEDAAELLRAAEIELFAGDLVDLALQPLDVRVDLDRKLAQRGGIERDPDPFQRCEHRRQRKLDVGVERELAAALELLARRARQQPGAVRGRRLRVTGRMRSRNSLVACASSANVRDGFSRCDAIIGSSPIARTGRPQLADRPLCIVRDQARDALPHPHERLADVRRGERRAQKGERVSVAGRDGDDLAAQRHGDALEVGGGLEQRGDARVVGRIGRGGERAVVALQRLLRRRRGALRRRLEPREQRLELELAVERVERVVRSGRVARALPVQRQRQARG